LKIATQNIFFFLFLFLGGLFPRVAQAQLANYYWAQSFNSVSSMLSGAVVAGNGGSSSIYYNPANISEAGDNSNLSLSAVMFSWRYYKLDNMLGNGISPKSMAFVVQPRFVTYVYNSTRSKFSFGGTVFTRIHERTEINYTLQKEIDILKGHPGNEQYNAYFDYRNRYDDTWVGLATAYEISPVFRVGISAFVSSVSLSFLRDIDNSALTIADSSIFSATYNDRFISNFNDFRVIFKVGLSYQIKNWRFGINVTTPSFIVLSVSKKLLHTRNESNITYQGRPLPDYAIFLTKEGKDVISHSRLPLAVSFGLIYSVPNTKSSIYFSMEHFFPLKPYLLLEAFPNPQTTLDEFKHRWLSVASGSKSLTNFAVGYSWKNSKNVGFMLGFRTDFNYLKGYDMGVYNQYQMLPNVNSDNYHLTGGAEFTVLKQKIITGVEISFNKMKKQRQAANFSDPVEYNPVDRIPLQGVLQNNAELHYFSISLYLSAVLNFGGNKNKKHPGNDHK
jgi:hypothetical protein